jgi:hypothetical protein
MKDTEPLNYAATVERYYYVLRGRFVALAAADWMALEAWHRLGIPIECVLKGMDRAFSQHHIDVTSLKFCDTAVKEVCQENCSILTSSLFEHPFQ